MYHHDTRLQYPVRVNTPDPLFARQLQQAIGGIEGEIRVCLQYFFQAWGAMHQQQWLAVIEELGGSAALPIPTAWTRARKSKTTVTYSLAPTGMASRRQPGVGPRGGHWTARPRSRPGRTSHSAKSRCLGRLGLTAVRSASKWARCRYMPQLPPPLGPLPAGFTSQRRRRPARPCTSASVLPRHMLASSGRLMKCSGHRRGHLAQRDRHSIFAAGWPSHRTCRQQSR
jgi:hypothetical protein